MTYQFLEDFNSRTDLNQYNANALLLYTLELYLGIEDIHSVATNSLTDNWTAPLKLYTVLSFLFCFY